MLVLLNVGPKCTLAVLRVVSHGEYADGTDRRTDGQTPDSYMTLSARLGLHNHVMLLGLIKQIFSVTFLNLRSNYPPKKC